jgi:hypothetical protein
MCAARPGLTIYFSLATQDSRPGLKQMVPLRG